MGVSGWTGWWAGGLMRGWVGGLVGGLACVCVWGGELVVGGWGGGAGECRERVM